MEAGTGIEPVFTDLQSNPLSPEINSLGEEKYQDKAGTTGERDTPPRKSKSILSRYIPDRHKRAVKMLGYALTLATNEVWRSTADVWTIRLTLGERYALALAALTTLPPDDMQEAVTAALGGAGMPLPPFLDPLDDAQWWADLATPAELRAYCFAAFMAMTKRDQRDFIEFAEGRCA